MKTLIKYSKVLLLLLVTMLTFAVTSCSDDETEGWDGTYGYVQFKVNKSVSTRATRAAALDKLEKLDDAKKIKVVMEHNGTTVSQTLVLNSYNAENAEYGLRSEKLQLASGTYIKVCFPSTLELDTFIGQLQKYGNTETQIVFSTPVPPRGIDVRAADDEDDEEDSDDFLYRRTRFP